jgi:hypothetical protein
MSRILKRPMFSMGGSTIAGITSGLSRQGYDTGKRVTGADILQEYGPAPRGYNVYDFLTEWGLNMASSPPMGNVIQTAAGTAREPYGKMVEGKGKAGQLDYAMRAQASDAARAQNLATDKMSLQERIHGEELASKERLALMALEGDDYFRKLVARPEMIIESAKVYSQGTNELGRSNSKGMALYDSSETYDTAQHKKGNIIKPSLGKNGYIKYDHDSKEEPFSINQDYFKEGDEYNIFWDPMNENWFTVTFDDAGVVQIDQEKSMITGDVGEGYRDASLIELQTYIENKREAIENEKLLDIKEKTNLPEVNITEEIKLKDIIHPTSDGTATGEISDEYIVQYAKDNKIVFTAEEFREAGGAGSGYKLMPKLFLTNKLKQANQNETRQIKQDKKKLKKEEKQAWRWYERWWDRYEAGTIQTPEKYKKHLDSYLVYKAEKTEKQLKTAKKN